MKTNSKTPDATETRKTEHLGHEYDPTVTNWTAVSFPGDRHGLTTKLRREARDAVLRCRGSEEKFQQFMDTLEVITAWGRAKLEADKAEIKRNAELASTRAEEEARRAEFRASIQAGVTIRVSATDTGFIEQSPRDGSIRATYDTASDERGPVAAMAQMMLAEGRSPTSVLEINAFGRTGIGSGQTLTQLAAGGAGAGAATQGGFQGIRV
ncbi:hypothetical protein [Vannielia sp. SX4]|uniref:hypothetical protein n=1 Tax=Vannielia sp. SX4 TaxID=3463852 RepID=UPI0040580F0D